MATVAVEQQWQRQQQAAAGPDKRWTVDHAGPAAGSWLGGGGGAGAAGGRAKEQQLCTMVAEHVNWISVSPRLICAVARESTL